MKLRYTLPALADLESALDYVAARSPQGAQRVRARIKAILDVVEDSVAGITAACYSPILVWVHARTIPRYGV